MKSPFICYNSAIRNSWPILTQKKEELGIKLTLQKNPNDYQLNSLRRVVGTELNAIQGDTIQYYKSDIVAGGGTSSPNLLNTRKYLEILRVTVEDSLKLMGYDFDKDIVGQFKMGDVYI